MPSLSISTEFSHVPCSFGVLSIFLFLFLIFINGHTWVLFPLRWSKAYILRIRNS